MRFNCSRAASMACALAAVVVVPAEARLQPVSSSGVRTARQATEASANLDREEDRAEEDEGGGTNIGSSTSIPSCWMRFPHSGAPVVVQFEARRDRTYR